MRVPGARQLTPLARIKVTTRVALRRRYGYAALRTLRRGVRVAMIQHKARQVDPKRPYSTSTDTLIEAYFAAIRRLRKRWPDLDPTDPRSEVEV